MSLLLVYCVLLTPLTLFLHVSQTGKAAGERRLVAHTERTHGFEGVLRGQFQVYTAASDQYGPVHFIAHQGNVNCVHLQPASTRADMNMLGAALETE